ncbi:helicase domain protein [Nitzschia inconspicua]|uniref:Helicase domain protein n=1 Tax=Nitzschia inconspicua TaxID=303405 RepID=A0A9K3PL47_9STRA|nr:helicase domain protein [Nitzschia inconspicua]
MLSTPPQSPLVKKEGREQIFVVPQTKLAHADLPVGNLRLSSSLDHLIFSSCEPLWMEAAVPLSEGCGQNMGPGLYDLDPVDLTFPIEMHFSRTRLHTNEVPRTPYMPRRSYKTAETVVAPSSTAHSPDVLLTMPIEELKESSVEKLHSTLPFGLRHEQLVQEVVQQRLTGKGEEPLANKKQCISSQKHMVHSLPSFDNVAATSSFCYAPTTDSSLEPAPMRTTSNLRLREFQVEQWKRMYQALVLFKKENGHCSVPHNYEQNPELARWVKRQRYQFKLWSQEQRRIQAAKVHGQRSPGIPRNSSSSALMTLERVQDLLRLGFVFDSHTEGWECRYRELIEYKRLNGHCNVPVQYSANKRLASWVKSQRYQYRHCKAGICQKKGCCRTNSTVLDRIRRLDAVGFDWNPTGRQMSLYPPRISLGGTMIKGRFRRRVPRVQKVAPNGKGKIRFLMCLVWTARLSLHTAWNPSVRPFQANSLLQMSSSYEEQYEALYSAFTEVQQQQPKTNVSTSHCSTERNVPSTRFPSEADKGPLPSSTVSQKPAYLQHETFLDFISASAQVPLPTTTTTRSDFLKSEPKSLKNITTSLDFAFFQSTSSTSGSGEVWESTGQTLPVSSSSSSTPKASFHPIQSRSNVSPVFVTSSYLDRLATDYSTTKPPFAPYSRDNFEQTSSSPLSEPWLASPDKMKATPIKTSPNGYSYTPAMSSSGQSQQVQETVNDPSTLSMSLDTQQTTDLYASHDPIKVQSITVQVQTILPKDVSIPQAKQAWLEFCWKQGGGIMVPTFSAESLNSRSEGSNKVEIPSTREFLIPYGLKQELVPIDTSNSRGIDVVGYRTIRRGPFWQDILDGSHMATVEFVAEREKGRDYKYTTRIPRTRMIWKVQFQVHADTSDHDLDENSVMDFTNIDYTDLFSNRLRYVLSKPAFWKAWTKFELESATTNLKAYLQTTTNLISVDHTERMPMGVSPREACDAWYEYCWRGGGGGSTGLPPITFQQGRQRWILPAMLEEEIVSMNYGESPHIVYSVNNPNIFTYPAHFHQGNVRFEQTNANTPTVLLWNVQLRPYRKFLGYGLQFWTKISVVVASWNLRHYLEQRQTAQPVTNEGDDDTEQQDLQESFFEAARVTRKEEFRPFKSNTEINVAHDTKDESSIEPILSWRHYLPLNRNNTME